MSIYDIGLNNQTEADGLAVPRASELAADAMRHLLSGAYTVTDALLVQGVSLAWKSQGLRLEASAAAGIAGPLALVASEPGRAWLEAMQLTSHLPAATHLAWTTGGAQLPQAEFAALCARGA
jgi:D-serine dehydratase